MITKIKQKLSQYDITDECVEMGMDSEQIAFCKTLYMRVVHNLDDIIKEINHQAETINPLLKEYIATIFALEFYPAKKRRIRYRLKYEMLPFSYPNIPEYQLPEGYCDNTRFLVKAGFIPMNKKFINALDEFTGNIYFIPLTPVNTTLSSGSYSTFGSRLNETLNKAWNDVVCAAIEEAVLKTQECLSETLFRKTGLCIPLEIKLISGVILGHLEGFTDLPIGLSIKDCVAKSGMARLPLTDILSIADPYCMMLFHSWDEDGSAIVHSLAKDNCVYSHRLTIIDFCKLHKEINNGEK